MFRSISLILLCSALAACATGPTVDNGIYRLRDSDRAEIQYRMLDAVNALRAGAGVTPLAFSAELTASAESHARDMSRQSRAWPFGSDGSNPYDRLRRTGFAGQLVGEIYAQTYETELDVLAAWVDDGAWGDQILDPDATDMGFAWQQDRSGLIWWVIVLGDRSLAQPGV